jgi:hypothetical protein
MISRILILLISALFFLSGCDTRSVEPDFCQINLSANPTTIFKDNNETYSLITAVIKDAGNFPIPEVEVRFRSNIGSVIGSVKTDSSGIAVSTFWDSNELGLATIEAICGETSASIQVNIIEPVNNEVVSISFDNAPLNIQVQGTGGQESAVLRAYLRDLNGNIINSVQPVLFSLINFPLGTLINGQTFSDSVMADNGTASVIISSGIASGIVRVRAATYSETGVLVSAEKSNIIIHSGPPNSVDFSISGDNSGEDMSGGLWRVEISALLTDSYGNPVDSGTAVFFSLPQAPNFASILANSFVGNENANGDTLQGTAFTYLTYEGTMTNEHVLVQVDTGEFSDTDSLRLPIQNPYIDITLTPAHLDWDESNPNNPPDNQTTTVRVIVKDFQNNPINNQRVIFNSSLGDPVDMFTDQDNDDFTEITGHQGENGLVLKEFVFHRYECPAPGPGGPGITTSTITASLLGNLVSSSAIITLYRYDDFNP